MDTRVSIPVGDEDLAFGALDCVGRMAEGLAEAGAIPLAQHPLAGPVARQHEDPVSVEIGEEESISGDRADIMARDNVGHGSRARQRAVALEHEHRRIGPAQHHDPARRQHCHVGDAGKREPVRQRRPGPLDAVTAPSKGDELLASILRHSYSAGRRRCQLVAF